jgi:hypothetical protein
MRHQRWLAAALALAWMLGPAQARTPQAAQAGARAATQRQAERTDQANRDAAVPDEASTAASGARPARAGAGAGTRAAGTSSQAQAPYGPVLYVNGKPVQDTGRRDPAEVHDEADSGANPAAQPAAPQGREAQQQQQRRKQQAARRRPAWQAENEPMAPRPLRGEPGSVPQGVPIPPPVAAPQPVVPSSNVINGCQGSVCTDAAGRTYNGVGSGNAGVNSNGRLCSRTGTTVQCF